MEKNLFEQLDRDSIKRFTGTGNRKVTVTRISGLVIQNKDSFKGVDLISSNIAFSGRKLGWTI